MSEPMFQVIGSVFGWNGHDRHEVTNVLAGTFPRTAEGYAQALALAMERTRTTSRDAFVLDGTKRIMRTRFRPIDDWRNVALDTLDDTPLTCEEGHNLFRCTCTLSEVPS